MSMNWDHILNTKNGKTINHGTLNGNSNVPVRMHKLICFQAAINLWISCKCLWVQCFLCNICSKESQCTTP